MGTPPRSSRRRWWLNWKSHDSIEHRAGCFSGGERAGWLVAIFSKSNGTFPAFIESFSCKVGLFLSHVGSFLCPVGIFLWIIGPFLWIIDIFL